MGLSLLVKKVQRLLLRTGVLMAAEAAAEAAGAAASALPAMVVAV